MFTLLNTQLSRAEMAVKSLERLSCNHHCKMFSREKDYSFSEGLVLNYPLALSNSMEYSYSIANLIVGMFFYCIYVIFFNAETISDMEKKLRSFIQRLRNKLH